MMNIRIKSRRKELNLTQPVVAKHIGVSKATISQWESGDTSPNGINLNKLASVLKTSAEWLLYEKKAPTFKSNAELMGGIEPWSSSTELPEDEIEIPFFTEVELAAGNGMIDVQEHQGFKLRFARSTLKKQGVDVANAACVKVAGNSMEPVLPDGSTVGIDTAKTTIIDGKMFAIDHEGMLRVKTLYRMPGNGVRLKSFNNDEYPDEIYNQEQAGKIRVIGKVFWYSVLI